MPFLLEAVKLSRNSGNNRLMANLLREVALAMLRTGDVAGARGCAGESLGLLETGGRQDVPLGLNVLAECEFLAGDPESALERASKALALGHALLGKTADIRPMIVSNTSRYLVALGRYAEATTHSTESLALAMDLRFEVLIAWNLENLAAIATLASELAPERPSVPYENAARVFGFVNSRLAALGSARDLTGQPQYNRAVVILNEALGAEAVTNLMTDGMSMTEREAIDSAQRLSVATY
jgi:tetratricopeptide (TPR) repeat protein